MTPTEKALQTPAWRNVETSIRQLAESFLTKKYAPPSALIDERGNILYIHGRTGKYLEPAPGEARLNIVDMAREGLRGELSRSIRKAIAEKRDLTCNGLRVKINGDIHYVGEAYRHLESFDLALEAYERAIVADPNFAPAYVGRARVLSALNPKADIQEDLETALQLDPNLLDAYLEHTALLLQQGSAGIGARES